MLFKKIHPLAFYLYGLSVLRQLAEQFDHLVQPGPF